MNRKPFALRAARSARPARRGLSVVETMIVLAVSVVTLGAAAPGIENIRARHQVEGVAAQLETDIQHVRGLAVAMNRTLRLEFGRTTAGSCWVVHTGSVGDCTCGAGGTAECRPGVRAVRSVVLSASEPVAVAANVRSIVFDPVKGTLSPTATMQVTGRGGVTIHQVANIMGRVRSCVPNGDVPGLRAC